MLEFVRNRTAVAVAVLILATSAVFAVGWSLSAQFGQALAVKQTIDRTQRWHGQIINMLEGGTRAFETAALSAGEQKALDIYVKASDAYRFVLFDRTGRIFWSSKADKIGERERGAYFDQVVARGSAYSKVEVKPASAVDGFDFAAARASADSRRTVVEVYLPVMRSGRFVGAIEHYVDASETIAWYRNAIATVSAIIGALALVLASALIAHLTFASRRHEREMQKAHERQMAAAREESKRNREAKILGELNDWLQSSKSLEELYGMISAFMTKMMPHCAGALYIYSHSRDVLDGVTSWNGGRLNAQIHPDDCWGLRRGRVYAYGENHIDFACAHMGENTANAYCCVPIVAHGETIGLLHIEATCGGDSNTPCQAGAWDGYKRLASVCAEQISLAIANVQLRDQLRDQSIRDPLTGLYNRRYLLEECRRELARSRRQDAPLALLSLDIDHFKKFNDNHGHDAGDTVLRAIGETLIDQFREEDVPCRYGGEEFVVLLPGADAAGAAARAEQLRSTIEQIVVRYGKSNLPRISASIGLATAPDCATTPQDLIKAADEALYEAKATGRNCVVLAAACRKSHTARKANGKAATKSAAGTKNGAKAAAITVQ